MERLLEIMRRQGLDAYYISQPINVRYISGYTSDDAFLLITESESFFLTDPRYLEQAAAECPDYTLVEWRSYGSRARAVAEIARKKGLKAIGFEDEQLTVAQYQEFQKEVPAELVPASGVVEEFRAVKRPEEIECLRISAEIACRAFERILMDINIGMTEKELAANLSRYMVLEGSDTKPYGNILISGPRTSLLHGIPSSRAIEYGDFVLMDFGCQYHGYISDMTRTIAVGQATPKQKEIYRLEQEMIEAMASCMKAGVSCAEVYEKSIEPLKDSEYFPYHYNGIGHGVGLFVHETPFIGPKSKAVLQAGNVVTIEPGIYIPNWGGVRIEDELLITEDGNENLIRISHKLLEL